MWNADLGYYYGKRFQLDAQLKVQNMLGDNSDSKMTILTDCAEPIFRIRFVDETKLPMEVQMSEFIEAKSAKAKGKRFSTLEIVEIEDITPAPVVEEESVESDEEMGREGDGASEDTTSVLGDAAAAISKDDVKVVDVPFTITNEVPEDSKPVDEQLSLF